MNPAVPRCIPVLLDTLPYSDTPYSSPMLPTYFRRTLFKLGFPEHTTHTRSLPIRTLIVLPLS